ncbi:putative 2-aminoethylphosphonate ABC transporter ATP-binding protein [Vibrio amylolyticus]|uniref:putative 2-aminoethylphosphonate ABC transporter ATP-binding protein n=1 Tax=Vibrio amylolyticus TaxID=2847292 RepID=UPI00354F4266
MNQSYLNIENLVKKFGAFAALKQISLSIQQGEFVCFLGPSGCGKTTLLRAIAGLDLPTSGQIHQDGKETTFLPPEKRDFGIVFQSYALFPNLTVQENIAIGLKNKGLSNSQAFKEVEYWLDMIGLPTSGEKYPNQLSGGQQQRVALARALALSPGMLLLDEPLSALDAKVRIHLREEICKLQRKLGITTVMVTHDQDEALSMADRIVVMNHGVIEQVGTPKEIYQRPNSRFVAEFVGSMNFIEMSVATQSQVRISESLLPLPEVTNRQMQVGDRLDLAVRPEAIRFVEDSLKGLPVRILSQEFLGAFSRIECHLLGDVSERTILVDISAKQAHSHELVVGEIKHIQLPSERLLVYPAANTSNDADIAA